MLLQTGIVLYNKNILILNVFAGAVPAFAFSSHPRVLMVVEQLLLRAATALLYFEVTETEPLIGKNLT